MSTSTREAEFVGAFEGGKQANWMYYWYMEVDQHFDLLITMYCNNNSAVALTQNNSGHRKIKHINIKTHWIHEAIDIGEILVAPILSKENIANIFMKSLLCPKLEALIKKMGMEYPEF